MFLPGSHCESHICQCIRPQMPPENKAFHSLKCCQAISQNYIGKEILENLIPGFLKQYRGDLKKKGIKWMIASPANDSVVCLTLNA